MNDVLKSNNSPADAAVPASSGPCAELQAMASMLQLKMMYHQHMTAAQKQQQQMVETQKKLFTQPLKSALVAWPDSKKRKMEVALEKAAKSAAAAAVVAQFEVKLEEWRKQQPIDKMYSSQRHLNCSKSTEDLTTKNNLKEKELGKKKKDSLSLSQHRSSDVISDLEEKRLRRTEKRKKMARSMSPSAESIMWERQTDDNRRKQMRAMRAMRRQSCGEGLLQDYTAADVAPVAPQRRTASTMTFEDTRGEQLEVQTQERGRRARRMDDENAAAEEEDMLAAFNKQKLRKQRSKLGQAPANLTRGGSGTLAPYASGLLAEDTPPATTATTSKVEDVTTSKVEDVESSDQASDPGSVLGDEETVAAAGNKSSVKFTTTPPDIIVIDTDLEEEAPEDSEGSSQDSKGCLKEDDEQRSPLCKTSSYLSSSSEGTATTVDTYLSDISAAASYFANNEGSSSSIKIKSVRFDNRATVAYCSKHDESLHDILWWGDEELDDRCRLDTEIASLVDVKYDTLLQKAYESAVFQVEREKELLDEDDEEDEGCQHKKSESVELCFEAMAEFAAARGLEAEVCDTIIDRQSAHSRAVLSAQEFLLEQDDTVSRATMDNVLRQQALKHSRIGQLVAAKIAEYDRHLFLAACA